MTDIINNTEPTTIKSQERMNHLMDEVTSMNPEKVSPLARALVAVEMAKDAIDLGKITPQEGLSFAKSLMDLLRNSLLRQNFVFFQKFNKLMYHTHIFHLISYLLLFLRGISLFLFSFFLGFFCYCSYYLFTIY